MKVVFADTGWEDLSYCVSHDRKIAKRILRLIDDIRRHPFEGIGKPEPLRHDPSGFWSRRITDEHRLVCAIEDERLLVAQARYRYQPDLWMVLTLVPLGRHQSSTPCR